MQMIHQRQALRTLIRNAQLCAILLGALGTAGTVTRQDASTQLPSGLLTAELHRGEIIRFNAPGPAAVASKIKCGPGGEIYAIYSSIGSHEFWHDPIRKISIASRSVTEYAVPAISGYQDLSRLSFDVSADGTLYVLLRAYPQSDSGSKLHPIYMIAKYKQDGQIDSHFTLGEASPWDRIFPTSIAMFSEGSSLISGTTPTKMADADSLGMFSAVFGQNGFFRSPVTLMKREPPKKVNDRAYSLRTEPKVAQQSAIEKPMPSVDAVSLASSLHSFSSSDGKVYVLQDDGRLNSVSPDGSVVSDFRLKAPADGLSALHVAAAGPGFLFVSYERLTTGEMGENSRYRSMIAVVYLQTGEVIATYRMPQVQTDFAVSACAASPTDFLFLSADEQGYLEVIHYLPN